MARQTEAEVKQAIKEAGVKLKRPKSESVAKVKSTKRKPAPGVRVHAAEVAKDLKIRYPRTGLWFEQGAKDRWRWFAYGEGDKLQAQSFITGEKTLADCVRAWDGFASHITQTHPEFMATYKEREKHRVAAAEAAHELKLLNAKLKTMDSVRSQAVDNYRKAQASVRHWRSLCFGAVAAALFLLTAVLSLLSG